MYSPDFSMAGKTGTAQMNYGRGGGMYYASSFVGYFPAEEPKYSCIVVIHRPTKGSYYGGDVAGPVFKRLAQKIFTDVPSMKEIKEIDKVLPETNKKYNTYYKNVKSVGNIMPNVVGLSPMDAIAILENLGLKVKTSGFGKVKSQSRSEGKIIDKKQTVILELS